MKVSILIPNLNTTKECWAKKMCIHLKMKVTCNYKTLYLYMIELEIFVHSEI